MGCRGPAAAGRLCWGSSPCQDPKTQGVCGDPRADPEPEGAGASLTLQSYLQSPQLAEQANKNSSGTLLSPAVKALPNVSTTAAGRGWAAQSCNRPPTAPSSGAPSPVRFGIAVPSRGGDRGHDELAKPSCPRLRAPCCRRGQGSGGFGEPAPCLKAAPRYPPARHLGELIISSPPRLNFSIMGNPCPPPVIVPLGGKWERFAPARGA